jgi:DNA-binding response OmpR family regulator
MSNIFSTQHLGKKQVLVVDNISDHSQLLAAILEMEGYLVETADCGYTAIAKIEANPPQLVLLDLMTLGNNGLEVIKWIRQNQPAVSIVIVSSDCELKKLPIQVQLDGFIAKPIDVDEVVSIVQVIFTNKVVNQYKNNF